MKVIIDTNIFIWWLANRQNLTQTALDIILSRTNTIYISTASVWEIIIKSKLGKLQFPESPEIYIPKRIEYYSFQVLPIALSHTLQVWSLEDFHRDPFDRIIIAQSKVENLPIITSDKIMRQYSIDVIW